jgi:large subunit ribosomal protein L29
MKNSEIIQLTDKELLERIDEERAILTKLKLNHKVSPVWIIHTGLPIPKNIARLQTEFRRKIKS